MSRNAIVQKLNEMDRYVSTELRLCDTDKKFPQNEVFIVDDVYEEIEQLPPAQPERKMGHWVETGDEPYDEWECDVCGFAIDGSGCIDPEEYRDVYKFCPNCGADMRGETNE